MVHRRDARIVDEVVEPAVFPPDIGKDPLGCGLVGDVGNVVHVALGGPVDLPSTASDHAMAATHVVFGQVSADPLSRAGDQGDRRVHLRRQHGSEC